MVIEFICVDENKKNMEPLAKKTFAGNTIPLDFFMQVLLSFFISFSNPMDP